MQVTERNWKLISPPAPSGAREPQRPSWWPRYYPLISRPHPSALDVITPHTCLEIWSTNIGHFWLLGLHSFHFSVSNLTDVLWNQEKVSNKSMSMLYGNVCQYKMLFYSQGWCGQFVKCNYCDNGCHNWGHQAKMSYNQMTQPRDKNILISPSQRVRCYKNMPDLQ